MVTLKWQGVWFMLALFGLGFFASTVEQPTLLVWDTIVTEDDRDDGDGEAQLAPDQVAVARRRIALPSGGIPASATPMRQRVVRAAPSNLNTWTTLPNRTSPSIPPILLPLQV
jgi:hypothetical protein